jgi:ribonuclease PH
MHDTCHCEVVQANGSVLGSAINCAVLVLLDAGVTIRGVLVQPRALCLTTAIVGQDNEDNEEDNNKGVAGSGRRRITVLVTESSSSDNIDANSDNGSVMVAMHTFGLPVLLDGLLSTRKI